MKIYSILFLLTALFLTACSSPPANTAENTTTANTPNATNTVANAPAAEAANTANTMNAANAAAQSQSPLVASAVSPWATMKAMSEAGRIKDTAAIKKLVSKASLAMMEANAKKQNTTVDELLKRGNSENYQELTEMRNEKITGNTATVEYKAKTAEKWTTMPLVMEDGAWRVAIDKYIETLPKRNPEEIKKSAKDSSKQAKTGKSKTNQ